MGSKTPVSILQEMCIRKGSPPHYELIHDGGGSHEALFKYQVFVGEVTAVGSGRSKKEAKHDAANRVLQRLKEVVRSSTPEPNSDDMMDESDVTSPYIGKLQENAVGALQELCMTNEIQVPDYKLIGDVGPPHEKHFTIMCVVLKLEESAVARTKKQAKQQAAYKMLNRLTTSLADVLTMTASEKGDAPPEKRENGDINSDIALSKYKELGTLASNTRKIPIGQKISEYHLMLKSLDSAFLNRLKEGDYEVLAEADDDPMSVLKKILEELSLDADFNGVESFKPACPSSFLLSADQHIILLSISTSPESVLFGVAKTVEDATEMAARNALEHLKLMTA